MADLQQLPGTSQTDLQSLRAAWSTRWPEALALWSKFTRLGEPHWCFTDDEALQQGLSESFAMIRLHDQAIIINLFQIARLHLADFALEIMAHEIGHHVYCPADLTDNARMIARMRWALPTREHLADFVSNLYSDLLINDRLQRSAKLRISGVYQALDAGSTDRMWTLYMRIYEILWSIQRGTLAAGPIDAKLEGDAQLGARLIRSYARDWLDGAGRFAALCFPYLLEDGETEISKILSRWRDTRNAGAGGMPYGLTGIEPGEREGAIHPALDPVLAETEDTAPGNNPSNEPPAPPPAVLPAPTGQQREPFEYGAILKSLGINLDDHEMAVRYYRERAMPYLVKFPSRIVPESTEPLPEGLEPWDIGAPLDDADWIESTLLSPHIIPGLTTLQRVYGSIPGTPSSMRPLDLDLYVDSSGSMPNPQVTTSHLTLAGAIIALSALRAGAHVQATLWSGARQFQTTNGFVADEHHILTLLTGYLGGSTAFPIHILRTTYQDRKPGDRPVHILIISDDGVTTLFSQDELGNSGWDIARMALDHARGGGTMVLNLADGWDQSPKAGERPALLRAQDAGWRISRVRSWDELVEFARVFSAMTYAER